PERAAGRGGRRRPRPSAIFPEAAYRRCSCRFEPDRGVVEHRAAAGEAGIGAGQQVDADALLEGVVRPQPLGDDDARLHALERAGMHDDAALVVADAHAVAVGHAERGDRLGMYHRGRMALASEARWRVVEARIQERARGGWHEAQRPYGTAVIDRRARTREGTN